MSPSLAPIAGEQVAGRARSSPLTVSAPDAERLLLQSRFVKNWLEAEILNDLESRIRTAAILEPDAVPPNLVTMNSTVLLRDIDTGREMTLTLVFPSCANSREGQVSVLTPLGSTLLGALVGQKLSCPIAGTLSTVRIERILRQPEASGDYYG